MIEISFRQKCIHCEWWFHWFCCLILCTVGVWDSVPFLFASHVWRPAVTKSYTYTNNPFPLTYLPLIYSCRTAMLFLHIHILHILIAPFPFASFSVFDGQIPCYPHCLHWVRGSFQSKDKSHTQNSYFCSKFESVA